MFLNKTQIQDDVNMIPLILNIPPKYLVKIKL